jgi:hypothetical protein
MSSLLALSLGEHYDYVIKDVVQGYKNNIKIVRKALLDGINFKIERTTDDMKYLRELIKEKKKERVDEKEIRSYELTMAIKETNLKDYEMAKKKLEKNEPFNYMGIYQ